ncbi:MAG: 4-(cytidine 5'-diphospho)-2-C-methyl-D-erythritol kinase [Fusobacteriaceae bacterium]
MRSLVISNCKINIGLNVTGVLENGYHTLDMVMVPLNLADKIYLNFCKKEGELKINSNDLKIPKGKENILHKIYSKYYQKTGLEPQEIEVYLDKKIPMEGGLGGGSSNGAMFLLELNQFHGDILTRKELHSLGKTVGADIPFFIENIPARVRGIGEVLEPFHLNLDCRVILVRPNFGVSTPEAFKNLDRMKIGGLEIKDADIDKIIHGMKENDLNLLEDGIENHLEQGLLMENSNIVKFRARLEEIPGYKFFMSGSGSTYFTLVSKEGAEESYNFLKDSLKDCEIYLCSFL